ncbi:serine acetyltransferase [Budviciaceae bacterium BWR-B9]|uniref:Serine acetyltransferase n=1 Tax=Limnobaculum allomyrinae TaxID=2791986 RepID=A0ABS1IPD9_9GAMM|nr:MULTISPECIES: serine O-acetyltransferase [Limnobaculum]MBK5143633.1 serine acetyltransferase [Limnobaculum allomyrinae]MBV7692649.1 serine O-acetyltransferase [Limnobaculum sp. M2-1]
MKVIEYIKKDLSRYVGPENVNIRNFLRYYFFNSGFKFIVWLRLGRANNSILRAIAKIQNKRFKVKYSLDIPIETTIGYGFYLGHGMSIVINHTAIIGNNVNLSQFTTIGSNKGKAATIGDNVYIGPSVCIVEDVVIGSYVKIGAGSVVTKDIPDNSVAVGVPAKVIKQNTVSVRNPA